MSWSRIDNSFPNHPKVVGLSDKAFRLHILALCYCGEYLTDGSIPAQVALKLGSKNTQRSVEKLVEAGLWIKTEVGYQIHDYLKFQTSKVQAEREKSVNRLKAQRARERKAEAMEAANKVKSNPESSPRVTSTHTPTPTPTPTPTIKNKDVQTSFEQFWILYPRKDGKKKAREKFEKALKTTALEIILEGVKNYVAFLKTTTQETAMPATWLHGERWNDEVKAKGTDWRNPPKALAQNHHRLEDPTGPYCGGCHQAWPCLTEQKKGGPEF